MIAKTQILNNWKSILNTDATDWLLEESNPSVRYFALRWLLDKTENDEVVVKAKQAVAKSAPVQKLIARQKPDGYWGADARPHHSTEGPLTLLLWLGAPKNLAIEKAMKYRIDSCLSKDGAYGIQMKDRTVLLPCHGAQLLTLMVRYGYATDPRTRKLLQWLVDTQESDGVWCCTSKVKRFPCLWATADVLRALNNLPARWLTKPVRAARDQGVELFLNSALWRYEKHKPSKDWFLFGYPLRWTSDVLDVLELTAPFATPTDERIQDGLNLVLSKQDRLGRWACEKHPKGGI